MAIWQSNCRNLHNCPSFRPPSGCLDTARHSHGTTRPEARSPSAQWLHVHRWSPVTPRQTRVSEDGITWDNGIQKKYIYILIYPLKSNPAGSNKNSQDCAILPSSHSCASQLSFPILSLCSSRFLPYFLSYSLPYFLPQCCPYFFPIFLSYVRPHYQAMGLTTEANFGCFTHWYLLSATCSAILVLKSGFFNLVVAFN